MPTPQQEISQILGRRGAVIGFNTNLLKDFAQPSRAALFSASPELQSTAGYLQGLDAGAPAQQFRANLGDASAARGLSGLGPTPASFDSALTERFRSQAAPLFPMTSQAILGAGGFNNRPTTDVGALSALALQDREFQLSLASAQAQSKFSEQLFNHFFAALR